MHRSGTSAISCGLQVLGVDLGERLIPPATGDNEKGFWEDIDISFFDDELLHFLGHDWHTLAPIQQTEFERNDLALFRLRATELLRKKLKDKMVFGLKDPRIARLLPFWKIVFENLGIEVSYVIAIRHPMSVVDSLNKRNGFELEKSYYLWLGHIVSIMLDSEGSPRVVVDYDLLMAQPNKQLYRIADALKLPFNAYSPKVDEYVKRFLTSDLQHTKYHIDDLMSTTEIPHEVVEAYYLLDKLARDQVIVSSKEVHDSFVQLNKRMYGMYPAFNYMKKMNEQITSLNHAMADRKWQIDNLNQAVAERDRQINECNAIITAIKLSLSWRITRPARFIVTVINNLSRLLITGWK